MPRTPTADFQQQAECVLDLPIAGRVNRLGGYGPDGEVIYDGHPDGCPSVLVTTAGTAKGTFMSNGSIAFEVKLAGGMDVQVLSGHFDAVEKRETGVPSNNLWLRLAGKAPCIASLVTPHDGIGLAPERIRVVKVSDPGRAMWFCASFAPLAGIAFRTAVRFRLVVTKDGPVLLRETFLQNTGRKALEGDLWGFFNLHGTQRFVYNKEIWYDRGMPLSPGEIVVSATVPYSDIVQVKRVSSVPGAGLRATEATCDYTAFVGDSACSARMPLAIRTGELLPGADTRLNRFSIATIAASRFALALEPGCATTLTQALLYLTDEAACTRFRGKSGSAYPDYPRVAKAYAAAAADLVRRTPDASRIAKAAATGLVNVPPPAFAVELPKQPVLSEYFRSLWTGVAELYENCRAHGAKMAQGIELGTRDRGQDMWPKLKEDPARVRADLVHVLGFMYQTVEKGHRWSSPLTRVEKLHGMYPRQYPSRWDDRTVEVKNDNRPYNDSPIWLVDSLNLYVRETGDIAILNERVPTVRLTLPETPEVSGLVGGKATQTVAEALVGIFEAYGRQVADSPYGLVQAMYGDWCDPLDMFGTSVVGDATTRGAGRGAQVRLSAHIFTSLVATLDLFAAPRVAARLDAAVRKALPNLQSLADAIRANAVRVAWEGGKNAGFICLIHELRADGSHPDYAKGETGYTLGSMRGSDFDGAKRRDLTVLAYGLRMLQLDRPYLTPVADAAGKIAGILATCDGMMFAPKLGLRLLHPPIANNANAVNLVGRMGIVPAGCAENGEYHHAQIMMHRFRAGVAGEADAAWRQFKPMVSATRDASIGGPFEMPSTSYASDEADPHFGKGMYFGLSGSTDWIVEYAQEMAGLELALHDDRGPAVRVTPRLPDELGGEMTLRRILHVATPEGGFRVVPLTVILRPAKAGAAPAIRVNGNSAETAEVAIIEGLDRIEILIEAGDK